MTFPQTLRELARLRPEIVPWLKYWFEYVSHDVRIERYLYFPENFDNFLKEFTQDKIDSIMAELGWEYEVRRIPTGNGIRWTANCFVIDIIVPVVCLNDTFPSKLSAARAALTAVVEELKKGEKG